MTEAKLPYHHGDLRAALLAAGEAELEAVGVEGFSLRSVARRAGVSHAAPAHHFGDVTGLMSALAEEGFRLFLASMQAGEAAAEASPRDRLTAAGLGYIDFALAHPALFRLMFASSRPDFAGSGLAAAADASFAHLVGSVSALLGRPALEDREGRTVVAAAWAICHGLADLAVSDRLGKAGPVAGEDRRGYLAGVIETVLPPDRPSPGPRPR